MLQSLVIIFGFFFVIYSVILQSIKMIELLTTAHSKYAAHLSMRDELNKVNNEEFNRGEFFYERTTVFLSAILFGFLVTINYIILNDNWLLNVDTFINEQRAAVVLDPKNLPALAATAIVLALSSLISCFRRIAFIIWDGAAFASVFFVAVAIMLMAWASIIAWWDPDQSWNGNEGFFKQVFWLLFFIYLIYNLGIPAVLLESLLSKTPKANFALSTFMTAALACIYFSSDAYVPMVIAVVACLIIIVSVVRYAHNKQL